MAGYQASNRLFRYAQASIVVPNHTGVVLNTNTGVAAASSDAALYVALDNNSNTALDYARAGVMPCNLWTSSAAAPTLTGGPTGNQCALPQTYSSGATAANTNTSGWEAVAQVVEPGPHGVTAFGPVALPPAVEGHGVFVSVYLSTTGNSVHTVIITPTTSSTVGGVTTTTPGATYNHTFGVDGPVYTDAQALADWTPLTGATQQEPVPPVTANTTAYTQFFDGRFTTWNGTKGTFNGKWIVNPVEANVLGGSTVVAGPSYLWTNDKFPGDAFGVWIYGGTAAT